MTASYGNQTIVNVGVMNTALLMGSAPFSGAPQTGITPGATVQPENYDVVIEGHVLIIPGFGGVPGVVPSVQVCLYAWGVLPLEWDTPTSVWAGFRSPIGGLNAGPNYDDWFIKPRQDTFQHIWYESNAADAGTSNQAVFVPPEKQLLRVRTSKIRIESGKAIGIVFGVDGSSNVGLTFIPYLTARVYHLG
jgi:hypothetical protein